MSKLILYYLICALGMLSFLGWGLFVAIAGFGFISGSLTFDEARKFPFFKSLNLVKVFREISSNGFSYENSRPLFLGIAIYFFIIFIIGGLIYSLLYVS